MIAISDGSEDQHPGGEEEAQDTQAQESRGATAITWLAGSPYHGDPRHGARRSSRAR